MSVHELTVVDVTLKKRSIEELAEEEAHDLKISIFYFSRLLTLNTFPQSCLHTYSFDQPIVHFVPFVMFSSFG
jgi:hypothetical protein